MKCRVIWLNFFQASSSLQWLCWLCSLRCPSCRGRLPFIYLNFLCLMLVTWEKIDEVPRGFLISLTILVTVHYFWIQYCIALVRDVVFFWLLITARCWLLNNVCYFFAYFSNLSFFSRVVNEHKKDPMYFSGLRCSCSWVICVTFLGNDITNVCALYNVYRLRPPSLCPPGSRVQLVIIVQ